MPAVQTPGSPQAAVQMPPAPDAAVPPGTHIVVKASADAWVTVRAKGGATLYSKLMHAGDSWPVPADKPNLVLTTGNAGGTEIDVDGKAVEGLGAQGVVRHDIPLDVDVLKSGPLPAAPAHVRPKPGPETDNG
jgi:cytoskeleton protein RodZ